MHGKLPPAFARVIVTALAEQLRHLNASRGLRRRMLTEADKLLLNGGSATRKPACGKIARRSVLPRRHANARRRFPLSLCDSRITRRARRISDVASAVLSDKLLNHRRRRDGSAQSQIAAGRNES